MYLCGVMGCECYAKVGICHETLLIEAEGGMAEIELRRVRDGVLLRRGWVNLSDGLGVLDLIGVKLDPYERYFVQEASCEAIFGDCEGNMWQKVYFSVDLVTVASNNVVSLCPKTSGYEAY